VRRWRLDLSELGDLVALAVLGAVWLVTGAWRAVPRHNEDACWECQYGVVHDRSAVVL